jgi:hypothetical protein
LQQHLNQPLVVSHVGFRTVSQEWKAHCRKTIVTITQPSISNKGRWVILSLKLVES